MAFGMGPGGFVPQGFIHDSVLPQQEIRDKATVARTVAIVESSGGCLFGLVIHRAVCCGERNPLKPVQAGHARGKHQATKTLTKLGSRENSHVIICGIDVVVVAVVAAAAAAVVATPLLLLPPLLLLLLLAARASAAGRGGAISLLACAETRVLELCSPEIVLAFCFRIGFCGAF